MILNFVWAFFLFRAGCVFVNDTVFFLAKDGLKGPAAPGAVEAFLIRPPGESAFEVTEFH